MARLSRGEVRWYKFARPDKKRPVVILTRDSVLEYMGEATVTPYRGRCAVFRPRFLSVRTTGCPSRAR